MNSNLNINYLDLSAMIALWHDNKVSFKMLAQKGFIETWIFWVKYSNEWLTGMESVF